VTSLAFQVSIILKCQTLKNGGVLTLGKRTVKLFFLLLRLSLGSKLIHDLFPQQRIIICLLLPMECSRFKRIFIFGLISSSLIKNYCICVLFVLCHLLNSSFRLCFVVCRRCSVRSLVLFREISDYTYTYQRNEGNH
jgi:hypothetical protein